MSVSFGLNKTRHLEGIQEFMFICSKRFYFKDLGKRNQAIYIIRSQWVTISQCQAQIWQPSFCASTACASAAAAAFALVTSVTTTFTTTVTVTITTFTTTFLVTDYYHGSCPHPDQSIERIPLYPLTCTVIREYNNITTKWNNSKKTKKKKNQNDYNK